MTVAAPSYKRHRYPVEIIDHGVWLYFRFTLQLPRGRGDDAGPRRGVSYETIRRWCAKFGPVYADELRRRRPRPGETGIWRVFVRINGGLRYLCRAVDQNGAVLDILIQSRRNAKAATKFFRKLLKGLRYVPRGIVTDKLPS